MSKREAPGVRALITTEGPTAASVVTYVVPAVSVALGATFLNEPTGANLFSGAALILLGVASSNEAVHLTAAP